MTAQEWEDWTEALRYFYFAWFSAEEAPEALRESLATIFSPDLRPDDPIGEYEDGRVSFIAVRGDDLTLIRFEPPSTTEASYLGSLSGGIYREPHDLGKIPLDRVEGRFSHKRLGEDDPLVVRLHPPRTTAPGSSDDMYVRVGQPQAEAVFARVRETLRRWATQPEHPQPTPT
jgi:hypothetical protein